MSKSFKINGDEIKESGEKLEKVGMLMIGSIGVFVLYFLIVYTSRDVDLIKSVGIATSIISIILAFLVIKNIIQSGLGFIRSVETIYKDGVYEEYYSNGKLKEKGTYLDGKKDGVFESYYYEGQLESRGTYIYGNPDGLWELYSLDGSMSHKSGYYENGLRVRPLK